MFRQIVMRGALIATLALWASPSTAQTERADPLQCWWRTSTGAIRVGEPFSVVLTCAVLENDAAKVIVDQSKLEPSVIQLPPFEVTGGSHGADLRSGDRRFFQYEYRLRLIAENLFGKDVLLPEMKLGYHVQSRVGQGAAIQGRDQSYVLPAQSIRVLSLVPADASDIRDTTAETFADVDERSFRANLLVVIAGVLFALAGLMALLAIVRLAIKYRKPAAAKDRFVTDAAILRATGRQLRAVQRAREDGGWTPDLAGRALSALRVAASYALGRTVTQARMNGTGNPAALDGQVLVASPLARNRRITVSGSVTPQAIARERTRGDVPPRRAAMLESLEQALSRFTTAQYGRENGKDDPALDQSLADGFHIVRRLSLEQLSPLMRWRRRRAASQVETRAWSR
jgi:hypothetical protein